jgi:prepilin-type N-terminal cleavage/methylation domain-containing protein
MQNIKLNRKGRKGFTLVEVALAVAVGLIVIGGAIVGFNAVRENASNSSARQKVDAAVGIVENLAASRNQIYPTSGVTAAGAAGDSLFATTWKAQRPDWNANPWGGLNTDSDAAAGNGVTEFAAASFGHASQATADAVVDPATPSVVAPAAGATDGAGNLIYQTALATGPWGRVADSETGVGALATLKTVKGYYIALYDKGGNPFWYTKGGK